MITVQGTIDEITMPGAALPREADGQFMSPAVPMAHVTVSVADPGGGSIEVVLPAAATGGLAVGPCRVMVESA